MKLHEYQTQNTLNPKLWNGDVLDAKLRINLLKLAKHFYEFLDVDTAIKDIILTGSNVNYNWTEYSDIDLHIMLNYKEINHSIPLVRHYMLAKKTIWNYKYPIKYKNLPVELYAQDINEPHTSTGIFSLMKNKWITKPSPMMISIDDTEINQKAQPYRFEIDSLSINDNDVLHKIKHIKQRIKNMRKTGLEASGEYSIENLAFKELRKSGYLEKLNTIEQSAMHQTLTLETKKYQK